MNDFSVIQGLKERKLRVWQAEQILRGSYGSGLSNSKYQQVYNYLDELAGILDGREETEAQMQEFSDFLLRLGFSENF